jgi:hypothetical protein
VIRLSSESSPDWLLRWIWWTSSPLSEPQAWQRQPSRFQGRGSSSRATSQVRSSAENAQRQEAELGLRRAVYDRSLDTLLRYETAIERQLYRAIDQLERLQRQRAGDYVPPPVKVGISTDV